MSGKAQNEKKDNVRWIPFMCTPAGQVLRMKVCLSDPETAAQAQRTIQQQWPQASIPECITYAASLSAA